MYIDTHIHAFTESIAKRALDRLSESAKITPSTDGTLSGAVKLLDESGIDYGVMLPIATKPSQPRTINDWAKSVSDGKIISFGTVHPYSEDAVEETERVHSLGLKGLKFHNDHQGIFLFDEKCLPVYKKCEQLGLPIVFHMGYDPISPFVHRAMPYDLLWLHEKCPHLKIIGAHMGGMQAWEAVHHYIAGVPNIYLDTACMAGNIDEGMFAAIVKKHGCDRILFGSDLPWSIPKREMELVDRLPITDDEKDRIFCRNAIELLGLNV